MLQIAENLGDYQRLSRPWRTPEKLYNITVFALKCSSNRTGDDSLMSTQISEHRVIQTDRLRAARTISAGLQNDEKEDGETD